jgi:predicted dehydrogenase
MIIATPSRRHLHDLRICLDAGKPVLCEKPLGLVGQADKLAKLDLDKARVGFNLRFHPAALQGGETVLRAICLLPVH